MGERTAWRPIGSLAQRVGAYCWMEHRLFSLLGLWASGHRAGDDDAGPAVTVYFDAASHRHGALAEAWRARMPVRPLDGWEGEVVPPPGPLEAALGRLADESGACCRLAALVEVVLPRALASYDEHAAAAPPVSEGPVLEVLDSARRAGRLEADVGVSLLKGLNCSGDLSREIERMFGGLSGVLPGEWAS